MNKIFLILIASTLFTSCKDFLDMPPKNIKVVYTMEDVREATSALLYGTLNTAVGYGWVANTIRFNGDAVQFPFTRIVNVSTVLYTNDLDLIPFLSEDAPNPARGGGSYKIDYKENKSWEGYKIAAEIWRETFNQIGYTNAILKDLDNVPNYNKTDYERISGEVRILRAYYLIRLNQLFAPYDNNDFGIPANFDANTISGGKRWKQTELYEKLIGEINDVMNYTTEPKASWNVFFNKKIMHGILAQMYQFKAGSVAAEADDWAKAEFHAKAAREGNRIENTVEEQFELTTVPLQRLVNKPHRFALLRFTKNVSGNNWYSPWGAPDLLLQSPSAELFDLYDDNDIRKEVYFKVIDGKPFATKYAGNINISNANETHILFRYSDLLLIEAEALHHQGKAGALDLLNEFKKSKIPGYTGYTGSDILGEIMKERRKEFFLEEQMNWLDMKRTNGRYSRQAKDEETGAIVTYTLEPNDYRYAMPLPGDKELKNNNIPQNPGWKY